MNRDERKKRATIGWHNWYWERGRLTAHPSVLPFELRMISYRRAL